MKKLFCVLLIACLIPFAVLADTSLQDMSYEDLILLNHAIVAEIMSRPEWKEVTVPEGQYLIGVDIPAGAYSIKCIRHTAIIEILTREGKVTNKLYSVLGEGESIGKAELPEGYIISISSTVVFAPPVVLGF